MKMLNGSTSAVLWASRLMKCASIAAAIVGCASSARAAAISPTQMTSAYSLSGVTFGSGAVAANGAGQTIAIIDWYNDPNILTETAKFNSVYGLQAFNGASGPTLSVVSQTGTSSLPTTTTTSLETALDVQWAHVMAPQANILLVEPNSSSFSDTDAAINYAKAVAGVSVISMSYGAADTGASYAIYDSTFNQAAGHAGVSFVASTGDASTPSYPATSSHVLAIGGTNLTVSGGVRTNERVWTNSNGTEGTGYSAWDNRPAFQNGVSTNAKRGVPDLVMDADPASGVNVYFGAGTNSTSYTGVGGTSLAAPLFAGLLADANEGRTLNGLPTLTGDQALSMIYALYGTPLYSTCFYDVTSGTANGYTAGVGYDTPSGMGAPIASGLLQYLAGYTTISVPEPTSAMLLLAGIATLSRRRRA